MADIDAGAWDALFDAGRHPCVSHAYLATLEQTGCVGPETGWTPAHRVISDPHGNILAAAPAYEKAHSYGEFVFDFAWANAMQRAGLDYYPKLVCAVPFTPVPGPRLAAVDSASHQQLADALQLAGADGRLSSTHVLFPDQSIEPASGWLERRNVRYVWPNPHPAGTEFDAFLATLTSKRRKEIRRELRRVADAGITFRHRAGDALADDEWATVYARYARTYMIRGQAPYLTAAFWPLLARRMPGRVRLTEAWHNGELLAVAIALQGDDTLFGRHWGTAADVDGLHFVTCYYQGIAYCLEHGLKRYDAGVQGEQKQARGFEPVMTRSLHSIGHPGLREAVAAFLREETRAVDQWIGAAADRTAYRRA